MTDMTGWTGEEKRTYLSILKDMAKHKPLGKGRLEGLPNNVADALIEVSREMIGKEPPDKQPTFVEKVHKWVSW